MINFQKLTKLFWIVLIALLVQSCAGKNKGCISKDEGSSSSVSYLTLRSAKGSFGNALASTLISMITQNLYGSAQFWDKNIGTNIQTPIYRFNDSLIYTTYTNLISNYQFKLVITMGIILYTVFLGLGFVIGTKEMKMKDIVSDIFRIGIVLLFTSKNGWSLYYYLIIQPIIFSGTYFGSKFALALDPDIAPTAFEGIDRTLGFVLSLHTVEKVAGLFLSGIYGMFTSVVLMYAIFSLIIMNLKGIVMYASNLVISGFLLCSGPIFIVLLLFEKTKDFFKNWFAALVSSGIQQLTIFMTLVLINHMGDAIVKASLYYEVCWASILSIKIQIPMPGFIKQFIKLIPFAISVPDNLINISIPLFNFFVFFQNSFNVVKISTIMALVIFSLTAASVIDVALAIGKKLSEFSIDPGSMSAAKDMNNALSNAHKKGGDIAADLAEKIAVDRKQRGLNFITGEHDNKLVKESAKNAEEINKLDQKEEALQKDGKELSFSDSLKRLSLKAENGLNAGSIKLNEVASLSFGDGGTFKSSDLTDKNVDKTLDKDFNNGNSLSKMLSLDAASQNNVIQHNLEIFKQHFQEGEGDKAVNTLARDRKEIETLRASGDESGAKAKEEVLQEKISDYLDDTMATGKRSIGANNTRVDIDGMGKENAEKYLEYFGGATAKPEKPKIEPERGKVSTANNNNAIKPADNNKVGGGDKNQDNANDDTLSEAEGDDVADIAAVEENTEEEDDNKQLEGGPEDGDTEKSAENLSERGDDS